MINLEVRYKLEILTVVSEYINAISHATVEDHENGLLTSEEQELLLNQLHGIYFHIEDMKNNYEDVS